ncbi:hypothetical protein AWZ03_015177, partial [Drosophila navojoa]
MQQQPQQQQQQQLQQLQLATVGQAHLLRPRLAN